MLRRYLKGRPTISSVENLAKTLDMIAAIVEASKATEKISKANTASPSQRPKP